MFDKYELQSMMQHEMRPFFESVRNIEVRRKQRDVRDESIYAKYMLETYDSILQHNIKILQLLTRKNDIPQDNLLRVDETEQRVFYQAFRAEYNLLHLPVEVQHQNLDFGIIMNDYAGLNPQIRSNRSIILYDGHLHIYWQDSGLKINKPDQLSSVMHRIHYKKLFTKIQNQPYYTISNDCQGLHSAILGAIDYRYKKAPNTQDFETIKRLSLQLVAVLNRNQNELNEEMQRAIKWSLLGICLYSSILGIGFYVLGASLLPMLVTGFVGAVNHLAMCVVLLLIIRARHYYVALSNVGKMIGEADDLPNSCDLQPQRLSLNGFFSTHGQQTKNLFGYSFSHANTGQPPAVQENDDASTDEDSVISAP